MYMIEKRRKENNKKKTQINNMKQLNHKIAYILK